MTDAPVPPVEWVEGPRNWWKARLLPASVIIPIAVGLLIGYFLTSFSSTPPIPNLVYLYALLALACVSVPLEFWLQYRYPSVRKLGISPSGLIVDFGIIQRTYPWTNLQSLSRTNEKRYSRIGVQNIRWTRIRIGSGVAWVELALSSEQGDRLARFLRVD